MIEVERKFQPTEEQLESFLKDANFLREVINHDIYYDFSDYRLIKENIRLRNRNGLFELKIGISSGATHEIEDIEEIERYFNTYNGLEDFIKKNLIILIDFETKRKKYKKGEFTIDVDKTSYGYNLCEIEVMIEKEEEALEKEQQILNLVKEYNFEIKKLNGKGKEYLRVLKPDVYKLIYENKIKK